MGSIMVDRRARFEEIYDAYSGLILAYAARRTNDPDAALDVVSETFMVAWRHVEEIPPADQARPWLYGVARRVLANHHRGVTRRTRLDERLAAELNARLVHSVESDWSEDRELIMAALSALSESDRDLLMLLAWDGLSRSEIAEVLGTSIANVRLRVHRARKRFEGELETRGLQRSDRSGHEEFRRARALHEPEEA
jgi:RNA polymerase sigma-70 factor (ECF subfamily)